MLEILYMLILENKYIYFIYFEIRFVLKSAVA